MRSLVRFLLGFALLSAPVAASALAVIGGNTRVAFGPVITGLTPGLVGTASVIGGGERLTVNFPITGGDLDASLAGTIRHDGSGVTLSNGINTLSLSNFVIDTTASLLLGDVALNGTTLGNSLSLFTFDLGTVTVPELVNLASPQLNLSITSTTAGALTSAFGSPDTSGLSIGLAATAPSLVPEPGAWAMMIIGFGAVGLVVRRRSLVATPPVAA